MQEHSWGYCPAKAAGRKSEKARKRPGLDLPYDFTVFGKRPLLAVKISLERGCFGEGREREIYMLTIWIKKV